MTLRFLTLSRVALALAAGLAMIIAVSAQAEGARKHNKHKKRVAHSAPVADHYRGRNLFPAGPVYNGQDYLGDDPDLFIRLQIMRDGARYGGPD